MCTFWSSKFIDGTEFDAWRYTLYIGISETKQLPPLLSYLTEKALTEHNCNWVQFEVVFDASKTIETFARCIAECILKARFGDSNSYFQMWSEKAAGTRVLTPIEKLTLEAFIVPSIGLPSKPAPKDHVEAVIAECLWYELTQVRDAEYGLPIRIEAPHFRVTEPGGDGLVIYGIENSSYAFRLWEIKKHVQVASATSKISDASKQLNNNGAEYLAKWSKVGQEIDHAHPKLSEFYGLLVEKWLAGSTDAMAGISLSKSGRSPITNKPVTIAKKYLPKLTNEHQIEGLVVVVPDLELLAKKVQEEIWNGI